MVFLKKKSKECGGDLLLIIISSSYVFLKNKKKYGEVLLDTFFLNDEIFRKKYNIKVEILYSS